MIMVSAGLVLMRVGRIKGHAFVDVGVPPPVVTRAGAAAGIGRAIPIIGVPTIVHRHAIDETTDGAKPCGSLGDAPVNVLVRGIRVKVWVFTGRLGKIYVFAASKYHGPMM